MIEIMYENREHFWRRVGEELRHARRKRGETLSVANVIRLKYDVRLDKTYLSRIERGRLIPPAETLRAIAHYYDIRPGMLMDPTLPPGDEIDADDLLKDSQFLINFQELTRLLGSKQMAIRYLNQYAGLLIGIVNRERGDGK